MAETSLFSTAAGGGAEGMAKRMGVPFLGRIPMDPSLGQASEQGRSAFGGAESPEAAAAPPSSRLQGTPGGQASVQSSAAGSATLSSLRRVIDQLVVATEGLSADVGLTAGLPHANGAGLPDHARAEPLVSNGQHQSGQLHKAPNTTVQSNGDIELDPALHYRIHLGM